MTPDRQKGQISLVRGDDQLIHFQWKNRQTGSVVDDFIIFPQDALFQKVSTGRETDRVYLLQYKTSSRRFFFWMQDKADDKDQENASKLNEYMNNPPQPNAPTGNAGGPGGQLDQNMLLQMLGAFGGQGQGGQNVQMADLQNVLRGMEIPQTSGSSSGISSTTAGTSASTAPTTSSVPNPTAVQVTSQESMGDAEEEEMLRRAIEESMKDDNAENANEELVWLSFHH